ncbi:MAG: 50S ribosomal protein L25 [Candidatus Saccharimonadales bacterium]
MADDSISLELELRTVTGKAVKHLRNQGKTPAVIHDHGKESVIVQAPYLDLYRIYQKAGKHHPIDLTAGQNKYTALIKTVTFEPRKNQLSHVVFNAVDKDQKVEAEVPVRPRYSEDNEASPAERSGLIVLEQLPVIEIKAIPDKLPDVLEYDAERLIEIGDQVSVSDLIIPEGVELITEPEHVIATVYEPSALAAANDAAGGTAEPEDAEEIPSEITESAEGETQDDENNSGAKNEKEDASQAHKLENE